MGRLKTTDLMAFDLVRHKKTKEVISVFEIDEYRNVINNEADGYCSETNIGIDDVEPIPLTPEILERNEFERHITAPYRYYHAPAIGMYDVLFHASEDSYEDTWHTEAFTDHNDNNFVLYNLCYVHELQHALRLCGLNDLADNLKLEEVK